RGAARLAGPFSERSGDEARAIPGGGPPPRLRPGRGAADAAGSHPSRGAGLALRLDAPPHSSGWLVAATAAERSLRGVRSPLRGPGSGRPAAPPVPRLHRLASKTGPVEGGGVLEAESAGIHLAHAQPGRRRARARGGGGAVRGKASAPAAAPDRSAAGSRPAKPSHAEHHRPGSLGRAPFPLQRGAG